MSAAMHFRKRQLLEYQVETNYKFLVEKKDEPFPSSPSSLESKTPSPVNHVAEPASVYVPAEHTPANSTLTTSEAFQLTPHSVCNYVPQLNPSQVEAKDETFPSSPSSLESKTPSPVKHVAEPASVHAPAEHTPANSTLTISEAIQSTSYSAYNYVPQLNPYHVEAKDETFPSSPSSLESKTPSPVKDVEPARVYVPTEHSPAFESTPYAPQLNALGLTSSIPMKQEAEAWAYEAVKLMQSIESILMQKMRTNPSIGPKPSAILMAKMKLKRLIIKLKMRRLARKTNPLPNPPTQNLTVHPSNAEEKSEVIAGSEVREEQVVPIDMTIKPSHSSFKGPEPKPVVQPKSKEELEQINNRIKRILANENDFQPKMEKFAGNGIHVYEQVGLDYPQKSDDILIRTENNSRAYKYTPPAKIPSPKKPFVHITADTLPEELNHLTAVADKINPPGQENPPQIYPFTSKDDDEKFIIGPNGTEISKTKWFEIDWKLAAPTVTRKVLMGVFGRNILATHSLSGRPSPAFMNLNKPEKMKLDAKKVADVVSLLTNRINVTQKEVRMAITSKCADECKIIKIKGNMGKLKAEKETARVQPYFIPVNSPNEE